ncbi:MAG: CBS domain-containing protein, partial [Solirubrobacteraceae bacterium]
MDPPPPSELITLVRALPAAVPMLDRLGDGGGVHLVGGAVRELLLGGQPQDLDLVVVGDAAAVARRLGGELRAHDRFGTCTVVADGFTYDVAYARRETYAYPGALPVVEPASLFEDLRRRDFTVNAAAIALGGPRPGKLTAVPGALEDLPAHRLRVLHDLSFVDDPTRLLRLIRYQSRLRFGPVPGTRRLALAAVRGGALRTVSGARVGAELRLLAREQDPVAALHALRELALDSAIHPGFGLRDPPLARRALALLPGDGRGDLLALALCARGIGVGGLADLLAPLTLRARKQETILEVAGRGNQIARALSE